MRTRGAQALDCLKAGGPSSPQAQGRGHTSRLRDPGLRCMTARSAQNLGLPTCPGQVFLSKT